MERARDGRKGKPCALALTRGSFREWLFRRLGGRRDAGAGFAALASIAAAREVRVCRHSRRHSGHRSRAKEGRNTAECAEQHGENRGGDVHGACAHTKREVARLHSIARSRPKRGESAGLRQDPRRSAPSQFGAPGSKAAQDRSARRFDRQNAAH